MLWSSFTTSLAFAFVLVAGITSGVVIGWVLVSFSGHTKMKLESCAVQHPRLVNHGTAVHCEMKHGQLAVDTEKRRVV